MHTGVPVGGAVVAAALTLPDGVDGSLRLPLGRMLTSAMGTAGGAVDDWERFKVGRHQCDRDGQQARSHFGKKPLLRLLL